MELKDSTVFIGIVITCCMVLLLLCAGVSAANRSHTSYVKCGPIVYCESDRANPIEAVERKQTKVETPKPVKKHAVANETNDQKSLEKQRSVICDIFALMMLLFIGMLPIIAVWVECSEHRRHKKTAEWPGKENKQIDPLEEAKKKVLESL